MKSIFLLALVLNVILAAVDGADSPIEKRGIFSRNHKPMEVRRRPQQVLPPIALPGIMNDYDPARVYHRGKRAFTSEDNSLENSLPSMGEIVTEEKVLPLLHSPDRSRRSILDDEEMIYVPHIMINRPKRDLRRLKRDLDYATSYSYPKYGIRKRNRYYGEVAYPDYVAPQEDLQSLLQGVDVLEYLALLKQAAENPSPEEHEKYNNIHSYPSRFAPQPRLFPEEVMRKENGRMWTNKHLPQGRIVWSPEKRSSPRRLSMVPGVKRSAFREAERMSPQMLNANSDLLNEILEKEANVKMLRSVAM